jgi:hypothetical protein
MLISTNQDHFPVISLVIQTMSLSSSKLLPQHLEEHLNYGIQGMHDSRS